MALTGGVSQAGAQAAHRRLTSSPQVGSQAAHGQLTAQDALAEGRLKVRGDVRLLTRHASVLSTVAAALGPVRANTEYRRVSLPWGEVTQQET